MITPDKKTKRKNILTAIAILALWFFYFCLHFTMLEFLIDTMIKKKT